MTQCACSFIGGPQPPSHRPCSHSLAVASACEQPVRSPRRRPSDPCICSPHRQPALPTSGSRSVYEAVDDGRMISLHDTVIGVQRTSWFDICSQTPSLARITNLSLAEICNISPTYHPCSAARPLALAGAHPYHICTGTSWAHPCPHLHRTGLTPPTSASGLQAEMRPANHIYSLCVHSSAALSAAQMSPTPSPHPIAVAAVSPSPGADVAAATFFFVSSGVGTTPTLFRLVSPTARDRARPP